MSHRPVFVTDVTDKLDNCGCVDARSETRGRMAGGSSRVFRRANADFTRDHPGSPDVLCHRDTTITTVHRYIESAAAGPLRRYPQREG